MISRKFLCSKGISSFQASDPVFYEGHDPVPVQDRCSVGNRVLGPFWTTLGTPFQEQYRRLGNILKEKVLTVLRRWSVVWEVPKNRFANRIGVSDPPKSVQGGGGGPPFVAGK